MNSDRSSGASARARQSLADAGVEACHFDGVVPNPTLHSVSASATLVRQSGAQSVVGLGGGSTTFPLWGITQNALVYRSLVTAAPQTPEAGVVAYDKLTGKLKWNAQVGSTSNGNPVVANMRIILGTNDSNPRPP